MDNVTYTSDLVAVVRCKDCMWHDPDFATCALTSKLVDDDFYCGDGERE